MVVKLKNRELVDLFDAMKQISETEKNNKWFTYAITLNEQNLLSRVVAILECGKPSEEYKAYEVERENLVSKYAERDDDKNYVVDNVTHMIKIKDEFVIEARQKFNELDIDNKNILDGRKKELKEYYELLEKETTVEIEQISMDNFPDSINKIMMKALQPILLKTALEE